jgi:hypothetical protein
MQHEWQRRGMDIGFWWENQKEKETPQEDLDVGGRIIFERNLQR